MDWANIASGGLLGLVGSLTGGVLKYFQTRQAQKFEELKWAHELKLLEIQGKRELAENEHELALSDSRGSWEGLEASIGVEEKDSYRWVHAVKALFRPALTTGLFVLVYLIYGDLPSLLPADEARDVSQYIVKSIVFAASTAGVWWFGDRAFAPPGTK